MGTPGPAPPTSCRGRFQDRSWAPSGEEEEIMYKWEQEARGSGVRKELAIFLSIRPTSECT